MRAQEVRLGFLHALGRLGLTSVMLPYRYHTGLMQGFRRMLELQPGAFRSINISIRNFVLFTLQLQIRSQNITDYIKYGTKHHKYVKYVISLV